MNLFHLTRLEHEFSQTRIEQLEASHKTDLQEKNHVLDLLDEERGDNVQKPFRYRIVQRGDHI